MGYISKDNENESIGIYYDREQNIFRDEDSFPIYEIFSIVTPNDILLFKKNKFYMITDHRSIPGVTVEIYWIDCEDDYYLESMDIGEDEERAERHQQGIWQMSYNRY